MFFTLKGKTTLGLFRLEKSGGELENFLEEERNKVAESEAALKEEKGKLKETTAELLSAQNAARSLEKEAESLLQRIRALEEAVGHLQGEADRARADLREREAEERRLCLNVEQLETDLRSSKAFAESLQTELHEKERREVEMLGEKEQAVAEVGSDPRDRQILPTGFPTSLSALCQAAEEARKEAVSRAEGAEEELEQRRGEVRDLEEKLRKSEEESSNRKARLDSFMKAMGSLQDDRDRVLNTYKQLEEKHLQVGLRLKHERSQRKTRCRELDDPKRSLCSPLSGDDGEGFSHPGGSGGEQRSEGTVAFPADPDGRPPR